MTDRYELRRKLTDAGLGSVAEQLAALARPSYRIERTSLPEEQIPIGGSKFGGSPDVPANFDWPVSENLPLAFVGQINLQDISDQRLPQSGVLSFFYRPDQQAWGYDPKDAGAARVFLFPDHNLAPKPYPRAQRSALERLKEMFTETFCGYKPARLRFESRLSLPCPGSEAVRALNLGSELLDRYGEWEPRLPPPPHHQLFGNPELVQNDMELECQLVTNGLYCGDASGYENPRAKELQAGAQDWELLLQVDSDDDLDVMWGDAGMIYYWIRRQDLAQRDFGRAWLIVQCH